MPSRAQKDLHCMARNARSHVSAHKKVKLFHSDEPVSDFSGCLAKTVFNQSSNLFPPS
jgi:hypothetical protein